MRKDSADLGSIGVKTMNAYYSTVFEHTAEQVWQTIRDFGDYTWASGVSESHIEQGKAGDAVSAIRNFHVDGTQLRQRLLAHSDSERSYTYGSCGPLGTLRRYEGTLSVKPVIDGDRAFVEWRVDYDCTDESRDEWSKMFADSFPKWLGTLRSRLGDAASRAQ
jgi:Polyketide cyclase / dehydrase and lipid transport